MRADLHIVDALRGKSDIDLATWRAAFDAIGIEVTFPDAFELPAPESAHSVTVRFRVTDARAWRLGDAIVAAEHVIELRRGRCELCSPPENKDQIMISGSALAAWLCAGTYSFASGRPIVNRVAIDRIPPEGALFAAKQGARDAALDVGRSFAHADGRKIEVRIDADAMEIAIWLPDDPDAIHRRRPADAIDGYVDELLGDGFTETTVKPDVPELDLIEEAVDLWRRDDPTFDVDTLAAPLRAAPHRAQIAEALALLPIVWVRTPEAAYSDNDKTEANRARARQVLDREDAAVDAALLLALRASVPFGLAEGAKHLLDERRPVPPAITVPALLSCMRPFPPSRNGLPGDAGNLLARYRPLPDELAEPLFELLEDTRWETAEAAARLLATRASEDRFFDAVWKHRDDGEWMRHAVVTACEIRCDPRALPWLEKLHRRRNLDAGWRERIGEAIATLRGS